MSTRKGYLWVDWVELGCRGWDLDEVGAWSPTGEAMLERPSVRLHLFGDAALIWDVLRDLRAAGLDVPHQHIETAYQHTDSGRTLTSGEVYGGARTVWRMAS